MTIKVIIKARASCILCRSHSSYAPILHAALAVRCLFSLLIENRHPINKGIKELTE